MFLVVVYCHEGEQPESDDVERGEKGSRRNVREWVVDTMYPINTPNYDANDPLAPLDSMVGMHDTHKVFRMLHEGLDQDLVWNASLKCQVDYFKKHVNAITPSGERCTLSVYDY